MNFLGRIAAFFIVSFLALYAGIALLLPVPSPADARTDMGGSDAAARLSQQAQSLVSHKQPLLQ